MREETRFKPREGQSRFEQKGDRKSERGVKEFNHERSGEVVQQNIEKTTHWEIVSHHKGEKEQFVYKKVSGSCASCRKIELKSGRTGWKKIRVLQYGKLGL